MAATIPSVTVAGSSAPSNRLISLVDLPITMGGVTISDTYMAYVAPYYYVMVGSYMLRSTDLLAWDAWYTGVSIVANGAAISSSGAMVLCPSSGGNIYASYDYGRSTQVVLTDPNGGGRCAYNGTTWVVMTPSKIYRSTDLVTWNSVTNPLSLGGGLLNYSEGVLWNGSQWLFYNNSKQLVTSTDLVNFSAVANVDSGVTGGCTIRWDGSQYIAHSKDPTTTGGWSRIYTSPTGASWTYVKQINWTAGFFATYELAIGGGEYLLGDGYMYAAFRTTNLTTLTSVTPSSASVFTTAGWGGTMAYLNNKFVRVSLPDAWPTKRISIAYRSPGDAGWTLASSSPYSWNKPSFPVVPSNFSFARSSSRIVAAPYYYRGTDTLSLNNALAYSDDEGATWTASNAVTLLTSGTNSDTVNFFGWSGGLFIISSSTGACAYSTDGVNWTNGSGAYQTALGTASGMSSVAALGGTIFVNNQVLSLLKTTDLGVSWTQITTSGYFTNYPVTLVSNGSVLAGTVLQTTTEVRTSPDGVTWTDRTTALTSSGYGGNPYAITTNGSDIYVASASGVALSSNNGVSWTWYPFQFRNAGGNPVCMYVTNGVLTIVFANGRVITSSAIPTEYITTRPLKGLTPIAAGLRTAVPTSQGLLTYLSPARVGTLVSRPSFPPYNIVNGIPALIRIRTNGSGTKAGVYMFQTNRWQIRIGGLGTVLSAAAYYDLAATQPAPFPVSMLYSKSGGGFTNDSSTPFAGDNATDVIYDALFYKCTFVAGAGGYYSTTWTTEDQIFVSNPNNLTLAIDFAVNPDGSGQLPFQIRLELLTS